MTRKLCWVTTLTLLLCHAQVGRTSVADESSGRTFDANGTKIWYSVRGQGEPVVLIHGWLASAGLNWELPGTSALLAKDHQVIELDVRGHGLSDKPTKEAAYGPELVEDIARLLDQVRIPKAHIVGYSMGGIIAGNFIARHPDRVLSGTISGMGWLKKGSVGEWNFAQIGKQDPHSNALAICGRSLAQLALTEDEIKSIKVPVTVLIGEKDDFIKRLYVDPLRPVRPDWPVVEIQGGNHITCVFKQQFREEIAAWIRKHGVKD
jgi:pimeloyl-ACP methyl ester carboxylesterase